MYLAVGNYRDLHGYFPNLDPFIYSIPGETLYWHHHWLGAQIYFWVEKIFTLDGVIFFKALLILGFPLLIFGQMRKQNKTNPPNDLQKILAYFLILLALFVSSYRFIERTSLFSDLLTCVVLFIGLRERNQKPRWMWLFPFIFVLWINLHPGFPLGIFLVGFFWLFDNGFFSRKAWLQKIKSPKLLILSLSALALFANPEGLGGILYPFLFSAKQGQVYKQYYFEWLPAYSSVYRGTPEALGFFLLTLISLILAFLKYRNKSGKDARLLLIFFFVAVGMSAVRFLNVASFALVILCLDFENVSKGRYQIRGASKVIAVILVGLIVKISFFGYQTSSGPRHVGLGLDPHFFPIKLASVYEQAHLTGNIYNSHEFGDYLAWRWGGNPQIFFHGAVLNTDFYQQEYRQAAASVADFDRLAEKYHWTVLFVNRYEHPDPFFQILSQKQEWRQGAEDESGFLFYKLH
jgi:hypothetical protein